MAAIAFDYWDLVDARGVLHIIRGCPARSLEELEYIYRRITEVLSDRRGTFELLYRRDLVVKGLCDRVLLLCGLGDADLSLQQIKELVIDPGHLYRITFLNSDGEVTEDGVPIAIANDYLENALVSSGLVQNLAQAKELTNQYSYSALQSILERRAEMLDDKPKPAMSADEAEDYFASIGLGAT